MLSILVKRNCKLFFKDKSTFFTSLVTPLILLVLYATFLGNVYYDNLAMNLPPQITVNDQVLDGWVAAQLFSALMSVSCVTVAFCGNMIMVSDKVNGARRDIDITPAKPFAVALSYGIATFITTLIICLTASAACFAYMASVGWFLTASDVLLLLLDVVLLTMFGTILSSIVNSFLSTQGQMSTVGTLISTVYGFICGAYMPVSQFGAGLQKVIAFLPGTYGTALLRNHALRGIFSELEAAGADADFLAEIKDAFDCNLYFFGERVSESAMFAIVGGSVAVLTVIFILLNMRKRITNK